MAKYEEISIPLICFIIALIIRLITVPISVNTGINPYTQSDAIEFANAAEYIAGTVADGSLFSDGYSAVEDAGQSPTYVRWGLLLAPFWLIPGPSIVYGTIFVGVLGAGSVYNVARIAGEISTWRASIFAAAPMTFYPSFIFVHTAVLREAAVIFCLTSISMLVITRTGSPMGRVIAAIPLAGIATTLRPENDLLIALAIGFGLGLWLVARMTRSTAVIGSIALASILAGIALIPHVDSVRATLLELRGHRFGGRTRYVEFVPLESSIDALIWGGSMGLYFIFTPFPSMIASSADYVMFAEAAVTGLLCLVALVGVGHTLRQRPATMGALLIVCVIGIVAFGLGTANVGTAVRHRQTFIWVLFIFAGVGLDHQISPRPDRLRSRRSRSRRERRRPNFRRRS